MHQPSDSLWWCLPRLQDTVKKASAVTVDWPPPLRKSTNSDLTVRGISTVKRRVVGCEAREEGSSLASTTKCWLTCLRQALLIPWAADLSPVKCTFREHACKAQGYGAGGCRWLLRGCRAPTCLKEQQAQRQVSFSQWGKDLYQEKLYFWKRCLRSWSFTSHSAILMQVCGKNHVRFQQWAKLDLRSTPFASTSGC